MENLNTQIAELKSKVAEMKELFKDEPAKVEIFGNMETIITDYLDAETGSQNGNADAENVVADFRKAVARFNESGK